MALKYDLRLSFPSKLELFKTLTSKMGIVVTPECRVRIYKLFGRQSALPRPRRLSQSEPLSTSPVALKRLFSPSDISQLVARTKLCHLM